MGTNDITGDSLVSKVTSQAYADGWERIFNAKRIEKAGKVHAGSRSLSRICKESGHPAIGCEGICCCGQTESNCQETP